MRDRESTQQFLITNILTDYYGQVLSDFKLKIILDRIKKEMKDGPCSWAFKENSNG